jgi:ADP-ribose pyrophosphatase YjhB (NUDIX family)
MNRLNNYQYCPYDGERLIVNDSASEGRPACPKCGFIDYQNPKACVAILITQGRKILLARRGIEPAKGQWDIPGGFANEGESVEDTVVREALEETSLRVRVKEYLGSVPDVYGPRQTPTVNLCFLVEVLEGELKPKSDVESLEWFSLYELPETMAFAHQEQVLQLLKEKLRLGV